MMVRKIIFLLIFSLAFGGCKTKPETVETPPEEAVPAQEIPAPVEDEEEIFDSASISREFFQATKTDIQHLIEDLNKIIRAKNYDVWVSYLGEAYLASISSPDYLKEISERSERLKSTGTKLSSVRDYFLHVVVPARANSRVDDIEFISQRKVKAFTVNARGERLRLYDLENTGKGWKIIN